jgi:adenosylcobinamide kinase / adenosylcobinamide-phosphate guanylyltransferase
VSSVISVVKLFMKRKIIFVTGGVRSGKSRFAQEIAKKFPGPKAYLATAQALDEEMQKRINRHRKSRPRDWMTLEEPVHIPEVIQREGKRFDIILLDCLTLWLSNLMTAGWSERKILAETDRLLRAARTSSASFIFVSNEVGLGIVPENPAGRFFRDVSGMIHQRVARVADEVYFLVCGLPRKIKG